MFLDTIKHIIEEQVECPPFEFVLSYEGNNVFLEARLWRKDTYTNEMGWGYGGKRWVNPQITERNLVMTCFALARDFAEHEVREAFKYRGQRIVGPHISLEAMWEAASRLDGKDDASTTYTN